MHKVLVALLLTLPWPVVAQEDGWLTRSGYYRVSYTSELQPLAINRIHSWTLHIETPAGQAVEGATIAVSGGMPLHNHGLPTAPKMTAELGDGDYRIEGMRFHMNGDWELTVTVDVGGRRDTVVIPLTL